MEDQLKKSTYYIIIDGVVNINVKEIEQSLRGNELTTDTKADHLEYQKIIIPYYFRHLAIFTFSPIYHRRT